MKFHQAIALFILFLPAPMLACGLPVASATEPGTFTAQAKLRNTAEACISLSQFTGQTLAIEVTAAANTSGRLSGTPLLASRTNTVNIRPGGGTLIVTGKSLRDAGRLDRYRITIRPIDTPQSVDALHTRWIFRGGQGYAPAQAVLTDGRTDFIRMSCTGGEIVPKWPEYRMPSGGNALDSPVSYLAPGWSGRGAPEITTGHEVPLHRALLRYDSAGGLAPDGRWHASNRLMDKPILSAPEKSLFAENHLVIGTLTLENAGIELAYMRLKAACNSGIVFGRHPATSCAPPVGFFAEIACHDGDLGALDRDVAELYGFLSALSPLARTLELWRDYEAMYASVEACPRGETECYRAPLLKAQAIFRGLLAEPVLPHVDDGADPSWTAPADPPAALVDEIASHGFDRTDVAGGHVIGRDGGRTFVLLADGRTLVVIHDLPAGTDPLDYRVDPNAPDLTQIIARKVFPVLVREFPNTTRRGLGIWKQSLATLHIVAGIRDGAPVDDRLGGHRALASTRYRGHGWISQDGVPSGSLFVESAGVPARLRDMLEAEARRTARTDARAAERLAEIEQARKASRAREAALAADAARHGLIYKAPGFWEPFMAPEPLKNVFHGLLPASDRLVLGWAAAFDEQCRAFLPADAVVLKSTAVTTWRNGLGQVVRRTGDTDTLMVDPRLAGAVGRAREGGFDSALALDALALGSGQLPNWSRITETARQISQPYADSHRLLRAGGCDGPVTRQYLAALVASVGAGPSPREVPLLSTDEAARLSDPAPAQD